MADVLKNSYTNKDFQKIYPELLDLVKQLTYKWDPSISNESDPGVILLKLNAIIADKCNYNIDKGVLECFPSTVTQQSNAYQLFEQLGYRMKGFTAPTVDIYMKWIDGDNLDGSSYTIPPFTMVSDTDGSIIYTLIGPSQGVLSTELNVGQQKLVSDGKSIITFKAIQGVPNELTLNGNSLITTAYLDDNNRIYFSENNIAENGIFIRNDGLDNYASWRRRDNLIVEQLGNTYYKLGFSQSKQKYYLEFPEDAETLFGGGLRITYITTAGKSGNIPSQFIERFYNDFSPVENVDVVLNSTNVKLYNLVSARNGEDRESIDDAYLNYQRTVGTFNTLVTLRDYFNVIVQSGLVSNAIVTDRTNDQQSTYGVITTVDGISQQIRYVDEVVTDDATNKLMSAFDLKLYLMSAVSNVSYSASYDSTFTLLNTDRTSVVKAYLENEKSISHDYGDILPITPERSNICLIKNKYPLTMRVNTTYGLTESESGEVANNIKMALYSSLNATKIQFGEEIDYDYVYDIIINSDARIKSIILDNIVYTSYAIIYDDKLKSFREIELPKNSSSNIIPVKVLYPNGEENPLDSSAFITNVLDGNSKDYTQHFFTYNGTNWVSDIIDTDSETYKTFTSANLGINTSDTFSSGDKIYGGIDLAIQISDEIFTKSVLCGVTPFFIENEQFDFRLNQQLTEDSTTTITAPQIIDNIKTLKFGTNIVLSDANPVYTLRQNENIQLYSPKLKNKVSYSNMVRYEYFINNSGKPVYANQDYQLQANEYIIFYWLVDGTYDEYTYEMYGQGSIICPNFELVAKLTENDISNITKAIKNNLTPPGYHIKNPTQTVRIPYDIPRLSGSKTVYIKEMNTIQIDSSWNCYWILQNQENGYYKLFSDSDSDSYRTLNIGEYLICVNADLTDIQTYGSGTTIVRTTSNPENYIVPVVDTTYIMIDIISALQGIWRNIPGMDTLTIQENQYIVLGEGNQFKLDKNGSWTATFTSGGVELSGASFNDFDMYYKNSVDTEGWTEIPKILLGGDYGWSGRSLLSLSMTKNNSIRLLSNQSIICTKTDDSTITLSGSDYTDGAYNKTILSSKDVYGNGLSVVNTVSYNENKIPEYLSLYCFKEIVNAGSDIVYNAGGGVTIKLHPTDTEGKSITFALPAGNYILPIINPKLEDGNGLTVSLDDEILPLIYESQGEGSINNTSPVYYFEMDIASGGSHTLTIELDTYVETIIAIKNCYRYIIPWYVNETTWQRRKQLLHELDIENLFDYTYKVSPDIQILNPLDPIEFLSQAHPYNNCTYCQMESIFGEDVGQSRIQVLGRR